ncbi:hypothetical protein LOZ12_000365 [Ophidiomyces ophidiicola]|uniref:Uncharacterized protein n=1 Tax=Ophidiomyces ophidiicola TaxID=1387563 RepID=A0ACB8UUG1_9EURO|nr:hypothetical protein LOZ64_002981 [Ophidiomyces ophidiicola]KAI1955223.1 hypothetical protein LOZ62_000347 [Ophidiomyces ophidiicola]KAI1967374.1 hypothetical protein LOZ59_000742 [Ophidiomyces ophidiicola]KAI1970595.1 hypothetical protein LOZ56_003558 [Ophidiomyces ophidiicola]KAI2012285.1 hypothetical protein LOZ50_000204 [Ophidiomyces ophidiicola]
MSSTAEYSQNHESSDDESDVFHDAHFPPNEEAALLTQSNTHKSEANKLFLSASYSEAISTYDRALAFCPSYLDYEIAVLRSNIAACHLKLEDWKLAIDAATASIECLDRVLPSLSPVASALEQGNGSRAAQRVGLADGVIELDENGDEGEAEQLKQLKEHDKKKEDVKRIRAKALMRRARGRLEVGGWVNLQGAQEDYNKLIQLKTLPRKDELAVLKSLAELPSKINAAREKEIGDMMGKLKELGNGILKPFGLSTDNFKFMQDEKTGGYNVAFEK